MATDSSGNVIAADGGQLRQITPNGGVTTLSANRLLSGFASVALDANDAIYGLGVFRLTSQSTWQRFMQALPCGGATAINPLGQTAFSDETQAYSGTHGFVIAKDGTVYVSDTLHNQILVRGPSSAQFQVLAGTGTAGADNRPALQATFNAPKGLALDTDGTCMVSV